MLARAVGGAGASGPGPRLAMQAAVAGPNGTSTCTGRLSGGPLRLSDEVVVLPGGARTMIHAMEAPLGPIDVARPGLSLRGELEGDAQITRGDLRAHPDGTPPLWSDALATVCWLAESPAVAGDHFLINHTTMVTTAKVFQVEAALDMQSLRLFAAQELGMNPIGMVRWW